MYSNNECYDIMASIDDVLAPHILNWISSEDFDEVMEAILDGVTMLESAGKIDSMCKNNGRVATM